MIKMASNKSKILAIAFCASVMTGLYASPVMAADAIYSDGKASVETTSDGTINFAVYTTQGDGTKNVARIASFDENEFSIHNGSGNYDVFSINRHDGSFKAANGLFRVTPTGRTYVDSITQNTGGFYITANGQASLSRDQVKIDYNGNITLDSKVDGGGNIYLQEGATVDGVDISKLQENSNQQNGRLDAVEEVNKDQNDRLDSVEEVNKDQNDRLDSVEEVNKDQNDRLDAVEEVNKEQNDRLDSVEEVNKEQNDRLDSVEEVNKEQNDRLDSVEEVNKDQNNRLDSVEEVNKDQNDRLDSVEEATKDQNGRLDAVEEVNKDQNGRLDAVEEVNKDQNGRLDAVEEVNKDQNGRLDAVEEVNKDQNDRIDNHDAVIGVTNKDELNDAYSETHYINGSESMVEADQRLDQAVYEVNNRVDGLENRVDHLEDRIDKVGAMAAAIANLRTMGYDPAAPTEVAVGLGQYRDETGAALGLFHYPNRDFMLSLSVSTSGDEVMGGIGATWKFGRKSPEKVAEIKKAQAEADARRAEEAKLAKAEEMKQAAKEAKIKAQQERHAKLAAERAAQAEAAK